AIGERRLHEGRVGGRLRRGRPTGALVEQPQRAVECGDVDHTAADGEPSAISHGRNREVPSYLAAGGVDRIYGRVRTPRREDLQYLDSPGELPCREVLGVFGGADVGV